MVLHFFLTKKIMSRIQYYFDTELSEYKRVQTRTIDVVINTAGIAILSIGIAALFLSVYSTFIKSPEELKLSHEFKEMEFNYSELQEKVGSLTKVLDQIENRDE